MVRALRASRLRIMRTVLLAILAASFLLLCPAFARAEDEKDTRRKEGAELVDQGIALYKAKQSGRNRTVLAKAL